jgi:hypothetical protein
MTNAAAALTLDRPRQTVAAIGIERPMVVPPAANDRPVALMSDFARAMRLVEQEVYGID